MAPLSEILPNLVGCTIGSSHFPLRLVERIGTGANGIVYLAYELLSPRNRTHFYAVKCLLRHSAGSDYARAQEREICLHSAVSGHPNVVRLHHVITEEHFVYLVMDYCPGGDLLDAIVERGIYEGNDAAIKRSFLQLIDTVAACHELGIYHRDLKPDNIMCSAECDQIYLTDFGLATQCDISNTFCCGSYSYMSPECLGIIGGTTYQGPYASRKADVWSLGIILINLITGHCPWHIAAPEYDPGFCGFVLEGAPYLMDRLPISQSVAELFTRTSDLNPATRITLPELRKATLGIETFSDPERELYGVTIPYVSADPAPTVELCSSSIDVTTITTPPSLDPPSRRSIASSDADSVGPITPPLTSQDPADISTGVTEFTLADGSGSPTQHESGTVGVNLGGLRRKALAGISRSGSGRKSPAKRPRLCHPNLGQSAQRFVTIVRGLKMRT